MIGGVSNLKFAASIGDNILYGKIRTIESMDKKSKNKPYFGQHSKIPER
jgi:hypothetical protein